MFQDKYVFAQLGSFSIAIAQKDMQFKKNEIDLMSQV